MRYEALHCGPPSTAYAGAVAICEVGGHFLVRRIARAVNRGARESDAYEWYTPVSNDWSQPSGECCVGVLRDIFGKAITAFYS